MKQASICFVVVVFAVCGAFADAPRVGVVTGTVFDPGGAPMAGATVQLISDRGSETSVSDAEGGFRFAFVIPDEYTVRADLTGFQSAEGMIVVSAGGRADVELRLGEVTADEIVVTGETPLINKFDVTGGGTVDAKELDAVVAPQRYYLNLLQYFPGVTANAGGGEGGDVEGTTSFHNIFYVDGVDASFPRWGGGSTLRLPNLAVGQLQMRSSRVGAEYSRATGAVATMVVKSGTNDFHGDLSAVFQNQDWNASFDRFPQDIIDKVDTRWEAALGGPIVKDKVWFFAAVAGQSLLRFRVLPSGDPINEPITMEPWIAKFDFRPSQEHSLALTAADTPTNFVFWTGAAEPAAAGEFEQGGDFTTLRWSWAISDDLFLDTTLAYQASFDNRWAFAQYEADPAGAPWSPAANNDIAYYDLTTNLFWNYISTSRPGEIDHPREQGNVSLNWFRGNHDVKFGLDYQETGWGDSTKAAPRIYGWGYNRDLPGGFALPYLMREYTGTTDVGGIDSTSETWGLFVRDRFTVGDHWTFNLGLRLDDQTHSSDVGTEIYQSTDIVPRATVVYDVKGDSRLLVTAGAGRYTDWIPMDMASYFNETPSGTAEYDQFLWVAAIQDFYPLGRVSPRNVGSNTLEPSYKDEFTLGAEWAFHPNWAFKTIGLYKETRDPYGMNVYGASRIYLQVVDIDGVPTVASVVENIPDGKLERTSLTFVLRRRFRDNWSMTAAYTWSETKANCYTVFHASCTHSYGDMRAITNDDGVPLSTVNRYGYPSNHLPHVVKIRGNYLFRLGKGHSVNVGGFAQYQSGSRWQLIANRTEPVPGVEPEFTHTVVEYLEPAGNRSLGDIYQIDLNASWRFPIARSLSGSLRIEILNATNQQEQVFIAGAGMLAGDPLAGLHSGLFQQPRAYRALVMLSF
jgi:hypothetical protein